MRYMACGENKFKMAGFLKQLAMRYAVQRENKFKMVGFLKQSATRHAVSNIRVFVRAGTPGPLLSYFNFCPSYFMHKLY